MTLQLDPDLDLRVDRVIRAPRERVWKAWTDPLDLARWWLPDAYVFAKEIPLTGAGKFLKRELRERYCNYYQEHN